MLCHARDRIQKNQRKGSPVPPAVQPDPVRGLAVNPRISRNPWQKINRAIRGKNSEPHGHQGRQQCDGCGIRPADHGCGQADGPASGTGGESADSVRTVYSSPAATHRAAIAASGDSAHKASAGRRPPGPPARPRRHLPVPPSGNPTPEVPKRQQKVRSGK